MRKHRARPANSTELHELGLAGAARAIRNGEVSSETFVCTLLERARAHADLKAIYRDRDLLNLTRVIERIVGPVPAPDGF